MSDLTYSRRCELAATSQGLDPIAEALDDAGIFGYTILNGGGYCMCLVVDCDGGAVVVTGWDTEPGAVMVGAYAGNGWEDGADPDQFGENIATADVLATVNTFAAYLSGVVA